MEKLTAQELNTVQSFVAEFNTLKMKIGDAELAKTVLLGKVDKLKAEYNDYENDLMEKYGKDAVVNVQTGEITRNSEEKEDV
ncbi:MAG: hypothetical protein CML17_09125 [Pusillimonas sp.]|nr:hypothetical protein [Pusillimonas sp.]